MFVEAKMNQEPTHGGIGLSARYSGRLSFAAVVRSVALLAFIVGIAAGCGATEDLDSCATDSQCAPGWACEPYSSRCVQLAQSHTGLEVVPPTNDQGWVRQEFLAGTTLQLDAAVSLQGIVRASDDTKPLPAEITVWRESLIVGRPNILYQTATPERQQASTGGNTGYVLWLTRGQKYGMYVTPTQDTEYPPLLEGNLELSDHIRKDVVLDGTDRAVQVGGRILDASGQPLTHLVSNKQVTYSVQVRAYHENGWLRSTPAVTCSDQVPCVCDEPNDNDCHGSFRFLAPFGVGKYTLRVESVPKNEYSLGGGPAVPTVECGKTLLGLVEKTETNVFPDLRMPAFFPPEEYTLEIKGEDDTPVVGAQVTLSTELSMEGLEPPDMTCSARYSRTATTDDKGRVKVMLIRGDTHNRVYRLTVVSPSQSPYASRYEPSFEVGPNPGTLGAIQLTKRYEIRGFVLDSEQNPVGGSLIEAQGILATDGGTTVPPTSTTTTTNEDGSYVLFVDPGSYHFHISPPQSAGVPHFSVLNKLIDRAESGIVLKAPEARLLLGQVLLPAKAGSSSSPASGFAVNTYRSVKKTPTQMSTVLRANALTDADGIYRLLVSP
jgi:protocatechuate 3,4-dioxygenase beta subunit